MVEVTNYIDRLVAELCPDGVEYRPLSDVVEKNYGGGTPSKAKEEYWGGDIPWASVGDLSNDLMEIFDTRSKITPAGVSGSSTNVVPAGAVIVAIKIAPGKMKIAGVDLAINQDIRGLVLNDLMNARFLTYYFRTLRFAGHGTIVKSITNKRLMDTEVPVPPLEIQEAIVEILDKFTNLEAELEAELEARTLQYEYYRGSLFGTLKDPATGLPAIAGLVKTLCPDGVEYRSLKDVVAKNYGGGTPSKSKAEYWEGNIPWASVGDLSDDVLEVTDTRSKITEEGVKGSSTNIVPAGAVIVAIKINPGRMKIAGMNLAINQDIRGLVLNDSMNARFLTYYFRTLMFAGHGTIVKSITNKHLMETKIPVPPMEIQQRIVDILDRFDALTTSLSEGLPAELAARRNQYEYYRDQLLSFPRKGENQ